MTREPGPRPFVGLLAGVAAGLVAAAAMAAFESMAPRLIEHDDSDGTAIAEAESSQTVRYVAGAVMGGIYGLLTEYRPEASEGFGSAYGVATAILEEGVLPQIDPDALPEEAHPYGLASHLVYGVVLEGVRWLLAGRR